MPRVKINQYKKFLIVSSSLILTMVLIIKFRAMVVVVCTTLSFSTSLAQRSEVFPLKETELSKNLVEEYFQIKGNDSLLTKEVKWKYLFSSPDRERLKRFSADSLLSGFRTDQIKLDEKLYHIKITETRKHTVESLFEAIVFLNKVAAKYGVNSIEAFGAKDKNAKPCYPAETNKKIQNP